jgi:ADP-heptose:LPS heptosyltransferase
MTQAGVPVRVGSSEYDAGHFTHNLYRPGLEWHQRHEARKALDMLEAALGEPVPDVPARIILGPAAAELAGKTIVGFNLPERYYVLQLGMGGSSRAMSPEFFAEVARQVDLPLILTGVPSELDLETRFRALYSGTWVSVNGKTDLATLSEVVRRAQFVLSVDTGTVHIAAAVGTPSVVIMPRRCIAPGHWSPWGTPSHVIRPRSFCPGCDDWRCLDEDDRCTRTVSVEETVEACRLLLQR